MSLRSSHSLGTSFRLCSGPPNEYDYLLRNLDPIYPIIILSLKFQNKIINLTKHMLENTHNTLVVYKQTYGLSTEELLSPPV